MDEEVALGVFAETGSQRPDHRHFVGMFGDVGEKVSHLDAGLTIFLVIPKRAHDVAHLVKLSSLYIYRHGLTVHSAAHHLRVMNGDGSFQ